MENNILSTVILRNEVTKDLAIARFFARAFAHSQDVSLRMTILLGSLVATIMLLTLPHPTWASDSSKTEEILGSIPVQEGGRVKPFLSFAREAILYLTEKPSYGIHPPVQTLWNWMAHAEESSAKPILSVKHPELRKRFKSDLQKNHLAPVLVLNDFDFLKEVRLVQAKKGRKERLAPLEREEMTLYERARFFDEVVHGRMPGFIPHPDNPKTGWLPLEAIRQKQGIELVSNVYSNEALLRLGNTLDRLLTLFGENDFRATKAQAELFRDQLGELLRSRDIVLDQAKIELELWYWKLKPFYIAWVFYLVSAIFLSLLRRPVGVSRNDRGLGNIFFISAFLMHSLGFAMRIMISGRPPVSNMYETVVWVPWACVLCSLIFWLIYRAELVVAISGWFAVLALLLAENSPVLLNPTISPLVPVLRNNYWLTVHVLTITLGYGAFALNCGIAHALLYHLAFRKTQKKQIEQLAEYLFRSLQIGLILLGTGTVLGGVWASYSWGRFWGWDPKETWALISFMTYLAVLHGRVASWLDQVHTAFWSALAFLTVIMAWYGVNFVLGAGLHSYGFGGGGLGFVLAAISADVIFLLFLQRKFKIKAHHG